MGLMRWHHHSTRRTIHTCDHFQELRFFLCSLLFCRHSTTSTLKLSSIKHPLQDMPRGKIVAQVCSCVWRQLSWVAVVCSTSMKSSCQNETCWYRPAHLCSSTCHFAQPLWSVDTPVRALHTTNGARRSLCLVCLVCVLVCLVCLVCVG